MEKSLLKQILLEYEEKRNIANIKAEERKAELLAVNPRLSEIESELSKISIQTTKAILIANNTEKETLLNDLKKKTTALIKEKNSILKSLSKDSDFLNPQFECKMCKDTGYVIRDGISCMCTCLTQRIYNIAYNKSNMGNLEIENFDTFDYRRFSDKVNSENYKSDFSPRQNIKLIREKAENFINNFDNPTEKNLVFVGNTGVGKTFMTNCIANEILKQGKNVLYQTAPVMLDQIIDAKFGKENSSMDLFESILNVDLLIIDDLGTETINDYKIEELFNIINTRLLNQNHKITKTIISTNLTAEELFKRYTPRIGSRLAGHYRFLRFFGEDLRMRKLKKNEN